MTLPITILKKVLDFKCMHIEKAETATIKMNAYGEEHDQMIINVTARPFIRMQSLCPVCRQKCVRNGHKKDEESTWRAPNLNGVPVYIKYQPQRILCPEHGALNEYIPWSDGKSRFTAAFNNEIAWLACQMSKTGICELELVNWRTVGHSIKAAHDRLEPDVSARMHDKVRRICVDETSYKKGYKYITVVYDMDKDRVIWIHEDHGYAIFAEFCQQLTPSERDQIEIVAGDGASWIDSCCKEFFPKATRCVDFFHVAQWINKALDEVRISTAAKAKREYNQTRNEYIQAESRARREYEDACKELSALPHRGRPSARKQQLTMFIAEYEAAHSEETEQRRKVGRPKKEKISLEHEATLKQMDDRLEDFKKAKYALAHNPENCSERQSELLQLIENSYPDLYKAYQMKETLRLILHVKDHELAAEELAKWITDAKQSDIKPMQKLAEKIETRHKSNILNAVRCQANSSKSEATNTTIKGLIKLARGFHNIENLIALVYLKCSDLIVPLCNRPTPSKEYLTSRRKRANELRRLREEQRRKETAA